MARWRRWRNWVKLHITGMGTSYILLLTAFYVDNGKSLPLWRDLSSVAYWLTPHSGGGTAYCPCAVVAPVGADAASAFPALIDYREPVSVDWVDYALIH
jgi:hypothetical protein